MTFDQVTKHFGSVERAKAALGIKSRQTVHNWREQGIPTGQQYRIQVLTKGALKAEEAKAAA